MTLSARGTSILTCKVDSRTERVKYFGKIFQNKKNIYFWGFIYKYFSSPRVNDREIFTSTCVSTILRILKLPGTDVIVYTVHIIEYAYNQEYIIRFYIFLM